MRLTPAEQIEQSYDLAMMALADYLTHERDATATIDALIRILDRDSLRDASPRSWSTRGCIRGQHRMRRRLIHELRRLPRYWLGMRSPPGPLLGWSTRLRLRRSRRSLPPL
ncbi:MULTISPECIES: hypothetical protein [unclassified Bradyrhizobium]|uniref:hypothetical protein n=1 Tax=unclassified Bradyrhizobium TaxID=2631580 RepID=UPI001FF866E1|nr:MULTISPECIES: hypothetical protein [unclassified Bradyrhizobium]MCK1343299.1 hypothetical protein [Bradyrhizobium sp. CW11]MCK1466898.1 hypothetical protein [Bradyrhizobium sp. CW10]MCK1586320.1 hypothetical protein [Bradyrhizobium sp. 169]